MIYIYMIDGQSSAEQDIIYGKLPRHSWIYKCA